MRRNIDPADCGQFISTEPGTFIVCQGQSVYEYRDGRLVRSEVVCVRGETAADQAPSSTVTADRGQGVD